MGPARLVRFQRAPRCDLCGGDEADTGAGRMVAVKQVVYPTVGEGFSEVDAGTGGSCVAGCYFPDTGTGSAGEKVGRGSSRDDFVSALAFWGELSGRL